MLLRPSLLALALSLAMAGIAHARTAAQPPAPPPNFDPARHMRVGDVRPGMTGYGLTVFAGVQIEPFAVEVVSVQYGFEPGQAVVWVRCPDERMQQTGPVQGMSGSPIYLWTDEDQDPQIGRGGRLLGAFAYGHRLGKDCYAGVQPIEQMLDAASRAHQAPAAGQAHTGQGQGLRPHFTAAFAAAADLGLDEQDGWRLHALARLVGLDPAAMSAAARPHSNDATSFAQPQRMLLPVTTANAEQAKLLRPFLAPYGLSAQAGPGLSASSQTPPWIDPGKVKLEPGSVFALPLTFGPMDMAAIGTTTEVLEDGSILAFGHSFFAMGDLAIPMASGYVHFIQPSIQTSFKLGAGLQVLGAMVRDEQTAVIGRPDATFATSQVHVKVRWPDESQNRNFKYDVVRLSRLAPGLVGSVVSASLTTHTDLPRLNTLVVEGELRFSNGWTLPVRQVQTGSHAGRLGLLIAAPIAPLIENEFGTLELESAEFTIEVEPVMRAAQLVGATIQHTTVRPGQTLVVQAQLQPYRSPAELKRFRMEIPADLPDGRYTLQISGPRAFFEQRMRLRPHLSKSASAEELFQSVRELYSVQDEALYASLHLQPSNNLAVGRAELPNLPSSRVALLAAPGSTRAAPYLESIDVITPTPYVVLGSLSLPVEVARRPNERGSSQ